MNYSEIVEQTVAALRRGETILYPTDTIWGIGCDARNSEAVERIYSIKERDRSKSMIVLVESGISDAESDNRPTTYILPRAIWHDEMHMAVADNLPAADGTLGTRAPRHAFCQEVIHRLGAPLVSTSANFSGQPSPRDYAGIDAKLMERIDHCVPPLPEFMSGETQGSRIVKICDDGSRIVIRP